MELEESLGRDLWIQNLTLTRDAVIAAPQEIWDLSQETCDQSSQMLLAGCSLTELSLVKLSLAEPSHNQLMEYD